MDKALSSVKNQLSGGSSIAWLPSKLASINGHVTVYKVQIFMCKPHTIHSEPWHYTEVEKLLALRALSQGKDTTKPLNRSLCEHICNNYTRICTVQISN